MGIGRRGLNGSSAIIVDSQISPVECGTIHDVPHPPFNVYFPHCTSPSLSLSPSLPPLFLPLPILFCGGAFLADLASEVNDHHNTDISIPGYVAVPFNAIFGLLWQNSVHLPPVDENKTTAAHVHSYITST